MIIFQAQPLIAQKGFGSETKYADGAIKTVAGTTATGTVPVKITALLTENGKVARDNENQPIIRVETEGKSTITTANGIEGWLKNIGITLDSNVKNMLDKWLSEQSKKGDNVDPGSAAAQARDLFNPDATNERNKYDKDVVYNMTKDRDDGFFKAV